MPNARNRRNRQDGTITVPAKGPMLSAGKKHTVIVHNASQNQILNAVDEALKNQTEILNENRILKERV